MGDVTQESRVAIVTAAGRGIGAACARRLAGQGYKVALLSPSGAAEALAKDLGGYGVTGSVTVEDDLRALVDGAMDRWGRVDALVNNTGLMGSLMSSHGRSLGPLTRDKLSYDCDNDIDLDGFPDALWHDALELFYLNVVKMGRLVTPIMLRQGGGAIVNITSNDVSEPKTAFPLSPIRAATHAYAKMYADRYGSSGIRMNCVAPGLLDNLTLATEEVRQVVPSGRLGTPDEIARAVCFLLSDDAAYISGHILKVDGSMSRSTA